MHNKAKLAFVTNICPHYRVRTFETLSNHCNVKFYFYSVGKEWYWQPQHRTRAGNFDYEYLSGFSVLGTRITPSLLFRLWHEECDAFVKCINGRFALPVTYLVARFRGKPFILWTGIWMRLETFLHRAIFPLTRHIYRNADAVVVYGQHVRDFLIAQGVKPEKIFVAHHAIDNAAYGRSVPEAELAHLRKHLGVQRDQRVILYLGRLEPSKGVSYLVDAFAQLGTANDVLVIAGEGSTKSDLEKRVTELGIAQRVRFTGYVRTEDSVAYYALAYVFVLPSITTSSSKEPWGLVVNEAMNQGCPVIATEAVGAAAGGLVRDGESGIVVPERDAQALRSALEKLLEDPQLRDRLSEESRATMTRWDNERMVVGFRRAVDYVLGRDLQETSLARVSTRQL